MDELLSLLFAAAVELSGLPAMEARPPVQAMPYRDLLQEICSDLKTDARQLLAAFDDCTTQHAMWPAVCEEPDLDSSRYERCTGQQGLVAAYIVEQGRIVYRDDLSLDNDIDNSFLVHEFVHALQDGASSGHPFDTCADVMAAERQAYAVQQAYLRSRGQMLRVGDRLRWVGCEGVR
ncbi:MAG TPA: hypothetical protein VJ673_22360 [Aromatoleum sp.]|uniref:hypothetical protein n=1 Tax=Aromatoleum sp. TaxID=2307007 RepID=UPI002B4A2138|nr:hypothetical protein [Aromatoleum sp.]HJV28438.1 hypothetical protein [Aromatoleum sp.]